MDTRYTDRGYTADFMEEPFGVFVTLRRGSKIVGEAAIGLFSGGRDEVLQVRVKRFQPGQIGKVEAVDDFE